MPATLGFLMVTTQRTPPRRSHHPSRGRLLATAAVAIAVAVGGVVYALLPSAPKAPRAPQALKTPQAPKAPRTPQAPAWKTVWTASFGGPAGGGVSTRVWKFDTGTGIFGTGEVETMTDSHGNVYVDGQGGLEITVLKHGTGSPGAPDGGAAWTSGRIQTRRLFAPPAGGEMLVTASIRQPDPAHGLGYWPGFWMLGPGLWPEHGEIDVLEDVNALSTHSGTFHCGNLTQRNSDGTFGPCHEGYGLGSGQLPCPGCQAGFNTYSVIIDRRDEADQQIRWYLDGQEFYSVSESAVGQAAWTEAVDHGFTILLDVAVGGSYPDTVCQCVSPDGQTSSGGTMTVRQLAVLESPPR
jgi:beta-glucanase (GH16 family)